MKVLIATEGSLAGIAYEIGHRCVIGRGGDCDIQVMDPDASRRHACVLLQSDGSVLLRDLASSNGTLNNGHPVSEVGLEPGDEIRIGQSVFEFRVVDRGDIATDELVVKLISGPAQAPTLESDLADVDEDEAQAKRALREVWDSEERATPIACCGSPLMARDRQPWWNFCPVCGAPLAHKPDTETLETLSPGAPDDPKDLN